MDISKHKVLFVHEQILMRCVYKEGTTVHIFLKVLRCFYSCISLKYTICFVFESEIAIWFYKFLIFEFICATPVPGSALKQITAAFHAVSSQRVSAT